MLPKHHFLIGAIATTLLYPLIGFGAFIALAASVLIDVDHYLLYLHVKKDFSIKKGYHYLREYGLNKITSKKPVLCVFHTIEAFAIMAVLAFLNQTALFIFFGSSMHLLFDMMSAGHKVKSPSILLHLINKNRKKEK